VLATDCSCVLIEGYLVGLTMMAAEGLIFAKSKEGYGRMVWTIVLEGLKGVEGRLHHLRRS
jgi:hypothetical protein